MCCEYESAAATYHRTGERVAISTEAALHAIDERGTSSLSYIVTGDAWTPTPRIVAESADTEDDGPRIVAAGCATVAAE